MVALAGTELNTGTRASAVLTNAPTLVNGSIYTIAFNGTDAAGNNATLVSVTGITYDTTAPTASIITCSVTTPYCAEIPPTSSGYATVRSTETGTAYLIKTSITGAADNVQNEVTISSANTDTNVLATGLVKGSYTVYAVDAAGNLSDGTSTGGFLNNTGYVKVKELSE